MNFDVQKAVNERRSARNYTMDPLSDTVMQKLTTFINELKIPFDHTVDIRFFTANPTKTLYLSMQSPPVNVAFITETDHVSVSKAGFIGEVLILYAQSLGIATCWYGHYKLKELEQLMPHLQNEAQLKEAIMGYGYAKGVTTGRRAICISPMGTYNEKGLRIIDRIAKNAFSFKRKEIDQLLENKDDMDHLPKDVVYALDLARKAPSAANMQWWRFSFTDNYKTIKITMPEGFKHPKWEHPNVELGICASHIWLALKTKGYTPEVSVAEDNARVVWTISI